MRSKGWLVSKEAETLVLYRSGRQNGTLQYTDVLEKHDMKGLGKGIEKINPLTLANCLFLEKLKENGKERAFLWQFFMNPSCCVGNLKPHCHSVAASVKMGYKNTDHCTAKELQNNVSCLFNSTF